MGIPHNRPLLTDEEVAAVAGCIRSGWVAPGPEVRGFETEFARSFGAGGACAVSSGTAALYIALRGLGVRTGDRVAMPTYACSALLHAVHMADALPLPIDVKPDDFCLDAAAVLAAGEVAAVIAVHCFGAAAEIAALKSAGHKVIEDCCQCYGGEAGGHPFGQQGDAAIASFYSTKIITCGHGGVVWDRSGRIAGWAADYIRYDGRETYAPRFNFQLTDMQAAMLRSQFARLPEISARRRAIAARYGEALPTGVSRQRGLDGARAMPYRFVVLCKDAAERDRLRSHLAAAGIATIVPVERFELLHRYLNQDPAAFPVAERLADTTLSLPLYPALSDEEVAMVCAALCRFVP